MRLTAALLTLLLVSASTSCTSQLRVQQNRLFVPAEFAGNKTEALLDAGAEMTVLDDDFAERIGLELFGSETARGTGGTEQVRFARGVDLRVIGVTLSDRTVAVLDLGDVSRRLVGEPVDAIVGRDLFAAGRFVLHVENARFRLLDDGAVPRGVRLPLTEHRGIMQFPVTIDRLATVQADFDLGNGSEVLIGRAYAEENGLLASERIVGTRTGGGIGGPVSRELIVLERLTLAGVTFRDVIAAIDSTDDAPDANIGVSVLRHFEMVIDFPQRALWLTPIETATSETDRE